MKFPVLRLLIPVVLLTQPLSALKAEVEADDTIKLTEVLFQEIEPGLDPFTTRLLLGEFSMRLDDGDDAGDYVLFNRQTHEIHSFNHEDKTQMVMKSLAYNKLDFILEYKVDAKKLVDAPRVNNQIPVQYSFYADNRLCKKTINVPGLLTEVTQVLLDYEQVIVEQNKQTLSEIPASIRSSCYMSNNYLHVSDYLKAGFPLFVIDDLGRQKKLLGFSQVIKDKSIMSQVAGYSLYYPNSSNIKISTPDSQD